MGLGQFFARFPKLQEKEQGYPPFSLWYFKVLDLSVILEKMVEMSPQSQWLFSPNCQNWQNLEYLCDHNVPLGLPLCHYLYFKTCLGFIWVFYVLQWPNTQIKLLNIFSFGLEIIYT